MSNTIIEVENLSFAYDKDLVLDGVSFKVRESDFVAIIGKNGAGKSTLINLLLSNLKGYRGSIKLFGTDIKKDKSFSNISYISQNSVNGYRNFPTTIKECVNMHLSFLKIEKNYEEILKEVGLYEHQNKALNELSGGQLQRLGIVLSLIKDAKLVLLDEPTTGIDENFAKDFFESLSFLKNRGKTVLIITHNLDMAKDYIDYSIRIKNKKADIIDKSELSL